MCAIIADTASENYDLSRAVQLHRFQTSQWPNRLLKTTSPKRSPILNHASTVLLLDAHSIRARSVASVFLDGDPARLPFFVRAYGTGGPEERRKIARRGVVRARAARGQHESITTFANGLFHLTRLSVATQARCLLGRVASRLLRFFGRIDREE